MTATNSFCTIITKDYMPWSLAFYDAIRVYDANIVLNVLVTDIDDVEELPQQLPAQVKIFTISTINTSELSARLIAKYSNQPNVLRWSLKPIFLSYLLSTYNRVIYSDSDIYYCSDYNFLWQELEANNVILSPHWRSKDPEIDFPNFQLLFNGGLYNGGFVAANTKGVEVLKFWAKNCAELCELNLDKGHFADQTHLNLLPVYFDKVKPLKHRGCNVASWNKIECKRTYNNTTGQVTINNTYPIVFIHFTKSTVMGIIKGDDALLKPYLEHFNAKIVAYGFDNIVEKYTKELVEKQQQMLLNSSPSFLKRVKTKLKKMLS
ncbi:MAG: hypothetical protein ACPGU9_09630 [Flavobacteriaceae bacterium]